MLTRSHHLAKRSALVLVFITLRYQYAHSSSLAEQLHLLFYSVFWKCRLDKQCSEKVSAVPASRLFSLPVLNRVGESSTLSC